MEATGPLAGRTVAVTADRKASEQGELFVRRGATVVYGPTIATVAVDHEAGLDAATAAVIAQAPDDLLVTTGMGLRAWVDAAGDERDALLTALGGARLTTHGPKSTRAARDLGLTAAMQPASERLDDAVELLLQAGVVGRRVVVQEHGQPTEWVAGALREAGADVLAVNVYRWRLPDDAAPARAIVDRVLDGSIDVVTFTSAPAVANLVAIADMDGRGQDLVAAFNDGRVIAGCVGIVSAEAARAEGIEHPVHPEIGRLGLLVRAVEEAVVRLPRPPRAD